MVPMEGVGEIYAEQINRHFNEGSGAISEPEETVEESVEVNEAPVVETEEVVSEAEVPAEENNEEVERKDLIEDPDNPLENMAGIEQLLKQTEQLVRLMEDQWLASAKELQITDAHMKELAKWNDDHKTPMPEGLSEQEQNEWDHMNGINSITEEEVARIFGERPHPIYGVDHSQTVDRIKGACNDFFGWLASMREYRGIHDAYLELLELEEEKNIEVLRQMAINETDPDKRATMEKSILGYYNRKYLEFLAEPMSDTDRNMILKALGDEKKIEYWIKRTRDKLRQLKISSKVILEISQFEKRFLEEKYWKNSNVLLLYFLKTCVYCNPGDKKDDTRTKVVCMVMALDAIIRQTWREERRENVLNNIRAFEDQFLPYISEPEETGEVAPPITEESEEDTDGSSEE